MKGDERIRTAVPSGTTESSYELREPWVDYFGGEWEFQYGELIFCPACAFGFGADHEDTQHGGWSCPNCGYDPGAAERGVSR